MFEQLSFERWLKQQKIQLLDNDRKTALLAINAETRQLELMAKLCGVIDSAPQFNFLLDARYVQVKQIMMRVLDPYPEIREAMADALLDIEDGDGDA